MATGYTKGPWYITQDAQGVTRPSSGERQASIADVLAWARTKPADESYNYSDNERCALCQFLRETGRATNPSAGGTVWNDWSDAPYVGNGTPNFAIPADLQGALTAGTFGGLVARLEKLRPDTPVTKSDWLTIDAYLTDIEQVSA